MLAEKKWNSDAREAFSQLEACERLGIAAIAVDTSCHIAYFNDKARWITEYFSDRVLRKNILDIVVSGDLKKCLQRAFKEDRIGGAFTSRSTIVTRSGRTRIVDWQGITLYGHGKAVGVLLTGIDVTRTTMVREAARIAAKARDIDELAMAFMDLLEGPFNLKIARLSIFVEGRPPLRLTRVFPHGGVRKKPRQALDDTSDNKALDSRHFRLRPDDRSIGALEAIAYAGSPLVDDDLDCIQALCDIISAGVVRLFSPARRLPDLAQIGLTDSAAVLVDPADFRVIDASSSFSALAGKADLQGARIEEVLPTPGLIEALRTTSSSGLPQWGTWDGPGGIFCCTPAGGATAGSSALLLSLVKPDLGLRGAGQPLAALGGTLSDPLLATPFHGLAVCDSGGTVLAANEALARLLGTKKELVEGRLLAEVLAELGPKRAGGKPLGPKQLALRRVLRTGLPAEDVLAVSVAGCTRTLNVSIYPTGDPGRSVSGCVVAIRDISVLHAVLHMGRLLASSPRIEDFVDEALDAILTAARLKFAWLYLYSGGELRLRVQKGDLSGAPLPVCQEVPEIDSPTLQCKAFFQARPVLIKDYRRCASVRTFDPLAKCRSIRSIAALPLQVGSKVVGVLVAATGPGQPIRDPQLAELSALGEQLSVGLARRGPGADPR